MKGGRGLRWGREGERPGPCAGVDEVGVGAWAGPVVAGAVVLCAGAVPPGLADSKALAPARRRALARHIRQAALWGLGAASAAEIAALGLSAATRLAMARAVGALPHRPARLLVDGPARRAPPLIADMDEEWQVAGDASIACVAAASILAKVARDRWMAGLCRRHPGWGLAAHKGYGTPCHRAALQRLGPSPVHRLSYAPVRAVVERPQPQVMESPLPPATPWVVPTPAPQKELPLSVTNR